MSKLLLYLLLTIGPVFLAQSQDIVLSGRITDSITNEGIAYANMEVINFTHSKIPNNSAFTRTDKNGNYKLVMPSVLLNDSILITSLGYKPVKCKMVDIKDARITMPPKFYALKEAQVTAKIKRRRAKTMEVNPLSDYEEAFYKCNDNLGYKNYKKLHPEYFTNYIDEYWHGILPIGDNGIDARYFKYVDNYGLTPYIREINAYLSISQFAGNQIIGEGKKMTLRVRVLDSNKEGKPGEDLLYENVFISNIRYPGKFSVDISKFRIIFPKNGIFIGFELVESNGYKIFLFSNSNKEGKENNNKTEKTRWMIDYGNTSQNLNSMGFFLNDKWLGPFKESLPISLTLME